MSDFAIRIENISKRYTIGALSRRHDTLRDRLADSVIGLFRPNGQLHGRNSTIWALRDVSLEVKQGEVVGIIGSNGAGKSTLLKILSRITEPTEGRGKIRGRVGSLLEVGTGFHPELTGRENVYLNGAILGLKKAEIDRKLDAIVDFADVEKFIDTPVKRYSSGMYVRLAFSVAAHLDFDILLIDEVLAVGDFAFQRKCLGRMQDAAGDGRTIIFVSHNMGSVKALCNRCLLLEGGSVLADGPAGSVVDNYINQHDRAPLDQRPAKIEADYGKGFLLHYNGDRGVITTFCGDQITLEFDIEAPKLLSEVTIGFSIRAITGEPIVSMSSLVQRITSTTGLSRFWRVRCDMGRLPINAGTYIVAVYVGSAERSAADAKFGHAFAMRVVEYDVFGWGKGLPPAGEWGSMYWAPQWDIRPMSQ